MIDIDEGFPNSLPISLHKLIALQLVANYKSYYPNVIFCFCCLMACYFIWFYFVLSTHTLSIVIEDRPLFV